MRYVKLLTLLVLLIIAISLIAISINSIPRQQNTKVLDQTEQTPIKKDCKGNAICMVGIVKMVIDGDTLEIDGMRVRLALVNTPERGQAGYVEAKEFTSRVCKVGSYALVDQDDKQPYDSYGRVIAKVVCGDVNLNAALLENGYATILKRYCSKSEFSDEWWAKTYGCE